MSKNTFSVNTAIAIVVANMIGTGVFTSLGFQLLDIQSTFVLMMLWLVGGVTALYGALTYAELGSRLPRSGGEYNFLSQIYHPGAGFVSGWISAIFWASLSSRNVDRAGAPRRVSMLSGTPGGGGFGKAPLYCICRCFVSQNWCQLAW